MPLSSVLSPLLRGEERKQRRVAEALSNKTFLWTAISSPPRWPWPGELLCGWLFSRRCSAGKDRMILRVAKNQLQLPAETNRASLPHFRL